MNPLLLQKMKRNAAVIGILLLVPLVLTALNRNPNDGWHWGPEDFIFGFIFPFAAALVYEVVALKVQKRQHRLFLAGVITSFACVCWIELATGGVSRNVANILKAL